MLVKCGYHVIIIDMNNNKYSVQSMPTTHRGLSFMLAQMNERLIKYLK